MRPYRRNGVIYEHVYEIILYKDSETLQFDKVFNQVKNCFPTVTWYWIFHDHDTKEDGTPKKEHYHLLLIFNREKSINRLAEQLGISPNNIDWKDNIRGSVQYLIHLNHPDKYQYDPDMLHSSMQKSIYLSNSYDQQSETDNLGILFKFIDDCYEYIGITGLQDFAREHGIWGCYRINRNDCIARLNARKEQYKETYVDY